MSTAVEPQPTDEHHGHDDWHHKPFSAHHFESAEQQFDSGKLGMWLFLITEVLFFSGLFCAYAVYRVNHPEVFFYASQYLDKYLGGLNTVVLIFSSLTMAWAVRSAQLGKQTSLVALLGVTLFCAALFLGVKTFEYTEKAHKRLLWAGAFVEAKDLNKAIGSGGHVFLLDEPKDKATYEERVMDSLAGIKNFWLISLVLPLAVIGLGYWRDSRGWRTTGVALLLSIVGIYSGIEASIQIHHARHAGEHTAHADDHAEDKAHGDHHDGEEHGEDHVAETTEAEKLAGVHPENEVVEGDIIDPMLGEETSAAEPKSMTSLSQTPRHANIFFSIYYFMTGLHAVHIIAGMGAITWLLVRSVEGHFRPDYFGPVDFVGLYWHIVDLIWIFLFPLLYLIEG